MEEMTVLMRLVEKFIRGCGSREDYKEIVKIEEDLLNWVLSDCRSEEDEEITEEMRKEYDAENRSSSRSQRAQRVRRRL